MRYFIIAILIITVVCCKTKNPRDEIEVYFSPGLVEHEYIDKEINKILYRCYFEMYSQTPWSVPGKYE